MKLQCGEPHDSFSYVIHNLKLVFVPCIFLHFDFIENIQSWYSADLNYPDKKNKTWNFERVFHELG